MFREIDLDQDGVLNEEECLNGTHIVPFKPHRDLFIKILKAATPPTQTLFKYVTEDYQSRALTTSDTQTRTLRSTQTRTRGIHQDIEKTLNERIGISPTTSNNKSTHVGFAEKRFFESTAKPLNKPSISSPLPERFNQARVPQPNFPLIQTTNSTNSSLLGGTLSDTALGATRTRQFTPKLATTYEQALMPDAIDFGSDAISGTVSNRNSRSFASNSQAHTGKNLAGNNGRTQKKKKTWAELEAEKEAKRRAEDEELFRDRFKPAPAVVFRDTEKETKEAIEKLHNGKAFVTSIKTQTIQDLKLQSVKDTDTSPTEPVQWRSELISFFPTDEELKNSLILTFFIYSYHIHCFPFFLSFLSGSWDELF